MVKNQLDAAFGARTRSGRNQVCRLRPGALRAASEWLDTYRRFWTAWTPSSPTRQETP